MATVERPTSPHLGIYKPQISSVTSIMHRFSGLALYAGAVLMVGWLTLAAYYPTRYAKWYECASSWCGRVVLALFLLAFYYHLANGIRHLFWDMGKGYSLQAANRSGWLAILFALAATAATVWVIMKGIV